MTRPVLRPFHPEDLVFLNRDGTQSRPAAICDQARSGPSFTMWAGETVLGCAGLVEVWPGVGFAWMCLNETIDRYGIWMTKQVIRFLRDIRRALRLHRIEAHALVESPRNQAWLERLGFRREVNGVATAYLADQRSVVRYEWVKEELWR